MRRQDGRRSQEPLSMDASDSGIIDRPESVASENIRLEILEFRTPSPNSELGSRSVAANRTRSSRNSCEGSVRGSTSMQDEEAFETVTCLHHRVPFTNFFKQYVPVLSIRRLRAGRWMAFGKAKGRVRWRRRMHRRRSPDQRSFRHGGRASHRLRSAIEDTAMSSASAASACPFSPERMAWGAPCLRRGTK